MQAIVHYSGGIGSWAAGWRAVRKYGRENTTLLFCDTKMEDEDLYRFLYEGAKVIGVPVTVIEDGRNPWEVFRDSRYIGNTRYDPCSIFLKRTLSRSWLESHYDPSECVCIIGMDYCQRERNRLRTYAKRMTPYKVEAPLFWNPPLDKDLAKLLALSKGLVLPRLYEMGFQHNNCGGACVKAGRKQWALLYEKLPERFMWHAEQEEELRQELGKDVAILRDRRGGVTKPYTLFQLAEDLDSCRNLDTTDDEDDSCSCFAL